MPEPAHALPPQYDPTHTETPLYQRWLDRGVFAPAPSGQPYVIVIPPPNVTAVLHMGHGLNCTVQDVLIRFERMRGRSVLWLPGTDHAGIATQNVVERIIAKEGKTRFDLGREAFVARVWEFVKETGSTILKQLQVIGSSCDWTRTRFTLDPAYSTAVREVFVRLWEEQLIYRGHRVIHWCPRCLTALSDEEAEFHDADGMLYYIRYPLTDGSGSITVATTRPETMLGDTAVVAHPEDDRAQAYFGKRVRLPIADVEIPVLADEAVDREFGTGFVKVTPAHDANDFEIGLRHKLDTPLIMTADGKMEEEGWGTRDGGRVPPPFRGMDRFEARKKIVKELDKQGLLVKQEQHRHAVRRCYRCDTVVEPRLSDQWFVKMKPLAEPVLAAYKAGKFTLVPERWSATFLHWMENIRDWNISRQLWWGHRIPVFTCTECKHAWADRTDATKCPKCGGAVEQDPDVLDTWFSSWLWPFATLGWPEQTPDLARFYPGHTLVTAPEILFLWVARMLMGGYHFLDKRLPFTTVYLTGTVRDAKHRKMSKSLGNGIDPLDVVRLYGADALRWTCVANTALGQDLALDHENLETTFAPGRNFANKLWNIGRFILGQLPSSVAPVATLKKESLTLADRWILSRLQGAVRECTTSLEQFRLDEASKRAYEFVWGDLADWYIETVKPRLAGTPDAAPPSAAAQRAPAAPGGTASVAPVILAACFDTALRLLHPVVPFITEELWQKLPGRTTEELITLADWPKPDPAWDDPTAEVLFDHVRDAVSAVRNLRAEYRVSPKTRLGVTIIPRNDSRQEFLAERDTIARLALASSVEVANAPPGPGATTVLADGSVVHLALAGVVDVGQECKRLSGEMTRLDKQIESLVARLASDGFVSRAPAEVVERERAKERNWREQRAVLADKLKALGCA